jgi:hypothetical protein
MTLLLLLFFLSTALSATPPCVYTQDYWRQQARITAVSNRSLCGAQWDTLMQLDLLRDPRQQIWLDAFHQCAAATGNLARLNRTRSPSGPWTQFFLAQLLDQLERGCTNLTGWALRVRHDTAFQTMLEIVRAFNRGQSAGVPPCGDEFPPVSPFSFANRSDLFMVVLPNNETVAAGSAYFSESLANAFQIKALFIAFIALSLALTGLVALMYLMLVRKKRVTYHCCEPRDDDEQSYQALAYGGGIGLTGDALGLTEDSEIDLSDLDPPGRRAQDGELF